MSDVEEEVITLSNEETLLIETETVVESSQDSNNGVEILECVDIMDDNDSPDGESIAIEVEPDETEELYLEGSENLDFSKCTAVTLPDGSSAFLAQNIIVEEGEESLQLGNVHTVYVQEIPKFIGEAVQLDDGSTVYLPKGALQPEVGFHCPNAPSLYSALHLNTPVGYVNSLQVCPNTLKPTNPGPASPASTSRLKIDQPIGQSYVAHPVQMTQPRRPAGCHESDEVVFDRHERYQQVQLEDGTTAYIALGSDVLDEVSMEEVPDSSQDLKVSSQVCIKTENAENDRDDSESDDSSSSLEMTASGRPKKYVCQYESCPKVYSTLHHLKVHERSHTGDRPYRCPESGCNKAFATGYGLKAHVRTHTGEKPYRCPEETCIKAFKTSGDLQKHVRTHTGERPFTCPFPGCGRSFTTSNIRKVHVRTHTGEKPYVCPHEDCKRAFASATNYKNHLRIHSGEKPYVCSLEGCKKRFTEYSSLYKHHMVHSQEKPYPCSLCARHYRQPSTLTMHKRTAHGIIETDDGTEIVLGETVFTLAKNSSDGKKLKALNANILGFKENKTLLALTSENAEELSTENQYIVMADASQLATLEQFGVSIADEEKAQHVLEQDST